ncbi:MAG: hypothetical protein ACM3WQ_05870 [Chloroflexota bacterium]
MVKIQQQRVEKSYLNGKTIYHYNRRNICIIKKYHRISDAFLNQELNESVTIQNGALVITLTPRSEPTTSARRRLDF